MTSKENQNVWTIHGKKYDFSAFVDTHPGGKDNILLGRGRDCTELFESVHVLSQDKPKALLRKYEIVTNPTDEKTSEDEQAPKELFTWERQGFYQTVASRVKKYFDENKLSYKGSWKYHLKIYAMLATSVYLLCTALYKGSYLFAFLAGIALEQLHFCSMHDGSHSAVSKSPFLNKLYAGITYWFFWDPWIWLRHHVYAHHCYTGIYRKDPDLTNSKVFVRKHHEVSWKPFYKLQHFHSWFWMMVLPNQHWGQTLVYALSSLKRKVFGVPLEKKPSDLIKPVILTFSFFFHFVFPLLVLSFSQMLAINFILWTIIGISYFTVVLPNHDTDLVNNTIATPSTENPIDWGELQVRNTSNHSINYNSITDRLTTVLYGGMNYQIEHHLFPAVCHEHYHMIAPIVQQTCKEFNIPYNAKGSWLDALVGHFHMLKVLGAKTKKY